MGWMPLPLFAEVLKADPDALQSLGSVPQLVEANRDGQTDDEENDAENEEPG